MPDYTIRCYIQVHDDTLINERTYDACVHTFVYVCMHVYELVSVFVRVLAYCFSI